MEKKIQSTKDTKQKRFLLILPLLTLPFLIMMFWAFGGGKENNASAHSNVPQGLNLKVPDPKIKSEKTKNKLGFYEQAAIDSAKIKEAEKFDPYWSNKLHDVHSDTNRALIMSGNEMDVNQMKVYNKLDELKKALNKSQEAPAAYSSPNSNPYSLKYYSPPTNVDRLQSMMQKMNQDKTEDPEITQLNDMLDKIQAIQEPKRTLDNDSLKVHTLPVNVRSSMADVLLLGPGLDHDSGLAMDSDHHPDNAFYSTDFFSTDSDTDNTIKAIIPETQTITTGSTIKFALCYEVTIRHVVVPAGTFIYGTASINNERLLIDITSIRVQNTIFPVSLKVFDIDGLEGIYVPGSIGRTVSKESANNVLSGMNMTTVDPSVGAQAASAGIEAAKTLFSKKIRLVRMTIKAGYKVLLKDAM